MIINGIRFNILLGAGGKFQTGEDSVFLSDSIRKGLKIYSSTKNIGFVSQLKSTWFKGYDEKFFYDKGAVFTAISKKFRFVLFIQYLLRHKEVLEKVKFTKAYKLMINGSRDYLKIRKM